jgi:hypothetical protein
MKIVLQVNTGIILLLLLIFCALPALAKEDWVADPKTGCQICWIGGSNFTLTEARWSGAVVDGKAEGKGNLRLTLQNKDGKTFTGKADAEMKQGKLHGRGETEMVRRKVFQRVLQGRQI